MIQGFFVQTRLSEIGMIQYKTLKIGNAMFYHYEPFI